MNKISFIIFILTAFVLTTASAQDENYQARQQFNQFKMKSRLKPETGEINYRGLPKPELQSKLNNILNVSVDDFVRTWNDRPTEKKFLEDIKLGLSRFNGFYADLDAEDKTHICAYFAKLMDDVGMESPEALLNRWIQNLEPADKQ
ncbi:DUF4844 domain-containing protein [Mucilaginibacter sp. RB4R14]|uniref:DUF4844 domain-containing protein n=1 Tax=Mucilaginibacter aurantiaciroseus TaxID=2949308 RepID=UPI002091C5C7|nr:DUF4844 domain-containing protein [Mucilaginibacter aurantiaciroseus]MCO5934494.1 DUF4844 domain-containing protein [Mucilaginibacter aurantiaciroseus]